MSAEEDAAARRSAWEAAGWTDYNQMVSEGVAGFQSTDPSAPTYALNDGRTTTDASYAALFNNPAPTTAPTAAPTASPQPSAAPVAAAPVASNGQTWESEKGKMTDTGKTVEDLFNIWAPSGMTGQQLWEQQNGVVVAPVAPNGGTSSIVYGTTTQVTPTVSAPVTPTITQVAPVTTTSTGNQPTTPGAGQPAGTKTFVADATGKLWDVTGQTPEAIAELKAQLAVAAAESQRRQLKLEGQKDTELDQAKIAQVAAAAYQQSYLQFQREDLAQRAANDAATREVQLQISAQQDVRKGQELDLQKVAQEASAAYQQSYLQFQRDDMAQRAANDAAARGLQLQIALLQDRRAKQGLRTGNAFARARTAQVHFA